jgi:signal transduction histidine kinase
VPIAGPVPVSADAQRLQQVFANLLDNAMKYTPRGGKIVYNITTEGGDAIVRCEDNGIGMSADVLPRIFDLFTQEESSRGRARSDGRDKGSVFTVRLPMHEAKQP